MFISEIELQQLNIPRYPGSFGEMKALSYITDYITAEKANYHFFTSIINYHDPDIGMIRIDDLLYEAKPYVFLRNTGKRFLKGKFYYVPRLSDLDGSVYKNGIVLIHEPLTLPNIRKVESSGVAAVITCGDLLLTNVSTQQAIICPTRTIENAQSSTFSGVRVSGAVAQAILDINPSYIEIFNEYQIVSYKYKNVICDLHGDNNSEIVIICAHYDTVKESPGALDNLSGMLILLKILTFLRNKRLSRKVRLCWFGAEEHQAECSRQYVLHQLRREKNDNHPIIVVNIDSADARLGCDQLNYIQRDKSIVMQLDLSQVGLRLVEGEYGGDDISFIEEGIPTVTFSKSSSLCDALHHRDWDTIANAGISDKSLSHQADRIVSLISPLLFTGDN